MSDRHLQSLKRVWDATGSSAAAISYLRERVRVGDRLPWSEFCLLRRLDLSSADLYLQTLVGNGTLSAVRYEVARRLDPRLVDEFRGDLESGLRQIVVQCGPEFLVHACLPHFRAYVQSTQDHEEIQAGGPLLRAADHVVAHKQSGLWDDLTSVMALQSFADETRPLLSKVFGSVLMLASRQAKSIAIRPPAYRAALELLRELGVVALAWHSSDCPETEALLERLVEDPAIPPPWPAQTRVFPSF